MLNAGVPHPLKGRGLYDKRHKPRIMGFLLVQLLEEHGAAIYARI